MEYSILGNSGVEVSRLCLGAMMFGSPTNENDSIRIIERAIDAGINFIDTANVYNAGESERIVGKAVKACRDDVLIATKVSGAMGEGLNRSGTSRHHIMMAVEDSLRRLDTDRIDLYYLHRWNALTPIEESLRALDDCVRQAKSVISVAPIRCVATLRSLVDERSQEFGKIYLPTTALQYRQSGR